jgi:hypothetical protein
MRCLPLMSAVTVLAVVGTASATPPYSLVALPDTQFYSDSAVRFPQFLQQTNWIKANRDAQNIGFVSHLGDIVQNGSVLVEWQRADEALDVLDTISPTLPYAVVPGNHDFASTGNKATLLANYLANFGPQRYAGRPWYGGSTANGWNHSQLFTMGGRQYLHLALEWLPASVTAGQDNAIEWAQGVLNAHPNIPTILSTHELIIDDFSIASGRSAGGEAIWNQLVRSNNQIFMTLNGHFHRGPDGDDGERFETATNNFGKSVFQLLSDYQAYPNGGDAYLRQYIFNELADTVHVVTYSPKDNAVNTAGAGLSRFFLASTLTPYAMPAGLPPLTAGTVQIDANSRFDIPLDFETRFAPVEPPPPPPPSPFVTLTFRDGVDGYAGTQDTYLASATPGTSFATASIVKVDAVDGSPSGPVQGLLRFDNIVGPEAGRIPAGATIDLATLTFNTTNGTANAVNFHRMLGAWDESSTWTSLTGGVSLDDTEARLDRDLQLASVGTGAGSADVTGSVRAWASGAANLGWVINPTGGDGWDFSSSDVATASQRPLLTVRLLAPGIRSATFRNGVNGYAGTLDTELAQAQPTVAFGDAASFSVDSDDPNGTGSDNHVLIRFQDILGAQTGRVPTGPNILVNRAFLVVEGFDPGDGGSVHRVLETWDESATWANSFGGNGVQNTGIEAVSLDDAVVAGTTGRVEIDVTRSLQAWVEDPSSNFGWVILPLGNNGWDIRSSESTSPPELRVYFSCRPDYNKDSTLSPADIFAFLSGYFGGCVSTTPACPFGSADFNRDNALTPADIFAFLTSYFAGC